MTSFIIYYVEGVVDFTDWAMVKLRKKVTIITMFDLKAGFLKQLVRFIVP